MFVSFSQLSTFVGVIEPTYLVSITSRLSALLKCNICLLSPVPLYQYYCLQSVKADLNRINNSLSELVTAQCLPGLQSPPVFRMARYVVTSPPPLSPLTVNPCSFWQDLSEVKESGLLQTLSLSEIRLQEVGG